MEFIVAPGLIKAFLATLLVCLALSSITRLKPFL